MDGGINQEKISSPKMSGDMNHEKDEEATLLDYLHYVPMLVFEGIAKYLSPGELRNLETVDPSLKQRCKAASRFIVYRPYDISLLNGKVTFQGDEEHTILSADEFKNSKYKASTKHVDLNKLTDKALDELFDVFDKRVVAQKLTIREICCNIEKLAQLMKELKITSLKVGGGFYVNMHDTYFPLELAQHPVMTQIDTLSIYVSLRRNSLGLFLKKNYKKIEVNCNESSDRAVAECLHNVLEEWLKGQRDINDYTIAGVDLSELIGVLLKDYVIVDEEEHAGNQEPDKRRPLAVSLEWDDEEEAVYKLIGYDNRELYIHLHDGTISLDKDRPIDISFSIEEMYGDILDELEIANASGSDWDEYYDDDFY